MIHIEYRRAGCHLIQNSEKIEFLVEISYMFIDDCEQISHQICVIKRQINYKLIIKQIRYTLQRSWAQFNSILSIIISWMVRYSIKKNVPFWVRYQPIHSQLSVAFSSLCPSSSILSIFETNTT